jgi:hypothetical protein
VALLLGTGVGAAVLALRYHQDVPAVVVTAILGLPGLFMAWAAYAADQRASESAAYAALSAAGLADRLAAAQDRLWTDEAARRQLNMPYPLPVRWTPADPSLLDDWDTLTILAKSGAGWPAPPSTSEWADRPGELAGNDDQLAAVLARVPTRRLVVLGDAGAGKTTLMIRLVLDMLKRRAAGDPVPVLVPVASWNPGTEGLNEWLTRRLSIDYPWLSAPAPPGSGGLRVVDALLSGNLVLPVLDGLDEIPETVRGLAVTAINQAAMPGESLVVTCRTDSYRKAVCPDDRLEVRLHAAAGIELCPLDSELVADYLRKGADGQAAKARWTPVLASLADPGPLSSVLSSPLMVGLAQVIYNPPPSVPATKPPDPIELCELSTAEALKRHLLGGFIGAAYRPVRNSRGLERQVWKLQQAERSLIFLARHLERTIEGPDFAWWQLTNGALAVMTVVMGLAAGLGCGLLVGLAAGLAASISGGIAGWLMAMSTTGMVGSMARYGKPPDPPSQSVSDALGSAIGPLVGLIAFCFFVAAVAIADVLVAVLVGGLAGRIAVGMAGGLAGGLVAGLAVGARRIGEQRPPDPVRWKLSGRVLVAGPAFGLAVGLVCGLVVSLRFGLIVGTTSGVLAGLAAGLKTVPGVLPEAAGAQATLARARAMTVVTTLAVGLPIGLLVGLAAWLADGRIFGLLAGVVVGLTAWLIGGSAVTRASWLGWEIARGWLALRRRLPWRLVAFLQDACDRGVLRQSGSVYQFRHIELQSWLASREYTAAAHPYRTT